MNPSLILLSVIGIVAGLVIACLGIEALEENLNGWLLMADGFVFGIGGSYNLFSLRLATLGRRQTLVKISLLISFYLTPVISSLEFLFFHPITTGGYAVMEIVGTLTAGIGILLLAFFLGDVHQSAFAHPVGGKPPLRVLACVLGSVLIQVGAVVGFSSLAALICLIVGYLPCLVLWVRGFRQPAQPNLPSLQRRS